MRIVSQDETIGGHCTKCGSCGGLEDPCVPALEDFSELFIQVTAVCSRDPLAWHCTKTTKGSPFRRKTA